MSILYGFRQYVPIKSSSFRLIECFAEIEINRFCSRSRTAGIGKIEDLAGRACAVHIIQDTLIHSLYFRKPEILAEIIIQRF